MLKAQAPRTTLMKLMDGLSERQIIYIHAPAGFGKTTSALLWLQHREALAGIKHAWISLDEHDNKTAEFCRRFVSAFSSLQPDNASLGALAEHPVFNTAPVEFALHALGAFVEKKDPCVFVLDDLHVVDNDEILKLLPVIFKRMHSECTVLLLSRAAPPDSFSEIVSKGALSIVDAEYLQFTSGEIKIFFSKNGRFISSKQANDIFASTGGWAIGIRALLMSEENSYSINLTGQYLESFLKTHVWERWDDRIKRFMMMVSVVKELTLELCQWLISGDKTLKKASCADILSGLVRENAFLRETGSDTYRFHDLFRDFLLSMLQQEGSNVENEQLKKAGEWFYKRKDYLKAVDCFLKCGHMSGIAKGLKLMYDYSSVHPIIEDSLELVRISLNSSVLEKYPYLMELQIWLAYMEGRCDDFEAYADSYYKRLPKITLQNPASVLSSVMVRCLDYRNSIVGVTKKLSKLPLLLFTQENTPPITQSFPLYHRSGRDFSEYAIDTDANIRLLAKTLGVAVGDSAVMIEYLLRAGLAYERGDLTEAHELALSAHVNLRDDFASEAKFCAFMMLAHVQDAYGNQSELEKTLEHTAKMIEADKAYFVYDNFRAYKCRLRLYNCDTEAAQDWLTRHAVSPHESLAFYKLYQHFTTARVYIVIGDYNNAILFLKKLLLLSERYRRTIDIIEARVLLAIVYWKKGRGGHTMAIDYLEQAVISAYGYGYTQIFINEGAELVTMLHKLQKRAIQPDYNGGIPSAFVKSLYISAVSKSKLTKGLTGGRPSATLSFTDKQKTVMNLMCQGCSRNEIAERIGLRPNGVKSHIELIYRKLDVVSSVDAVLKIKELGILDDLQ